MRILNRPSLGNNMEEASEGDSLADLASQEEASTSKIWWEEDFSEAEDTLASDSSSIIIKDTEGMDSGEQPIHSVSVEEKEWGFNFDE